LIAGRRPKPTKLRIIEGNPGKRRINADEPQPPALGGPPAHLDDTLLPLWNEVVQAAPPHVLTAADAVVIELTARLLFQMRTSPEVGPGLAVQLRQCLGELGMTPSARSRLSVAKPGPANRFENL
jgi:phage terminase small subunit